MNISYNCISDTTPILELPLLVFVDARRNEGIKNLPLLREKGCEVIASDADNSFNWFKGHLRLGALGAYKYVKQCRKSSSKRHPHSQKYYDSKTNEELFLNHFTSLVKNEIEKACGDKNYYWNNPLPKGQLIAYVQEDYPFIDTENM